MTNKKHSFSVVFCALIALALLYPGVTKPVLSLSGSVEKSDIAQLGINMLAGDDGSSQAHQMLSGMSSFFGLNNIEGDVMVYQSTRSIWGTVQSLAGSGHLLVAFLIVFFSVWIPLFKLLLQLSVVFLGNTRWKARVLLLNGALSKWSMADVFVMALLVAYLAGSASENMGDWLVMDAQLEVGFYYFLAYCVFSIAAGVFLSALCRETKSTA